MVQCKSHKTITIIERVFIEQVYHLSASEENPPEQNDWHGDPVRWHDPQPVSITVTCFDCGFERIYGPRTPLPKWVRALWPASEEEEHEEKGQTHVECH